jgi:hypothetical protein
MKRLAPLVVAAALTAPGCYGSYGATKALNHWNATVSTDRIAQSAVHLGLWIIPVYPLAFLGDFFIFNNVEFITGKPVFQ